MNLTDTEIVAACARAMGYVLKRDALGPWKHDEDGRLTYNPLTDRAQAMELVEMLLVAGIGFYVSPHHAAFCWQETGSEIFRLQDDMTKSENLLRAICLCAARVQIEKEKNRA